MIGTILGREARIELTVRGPNGDRLRLEAVVDTGSSGWLTLSSAVIEHLKLPGTGIVRAMLANGAEAVFETFAATVIWHGRVVNIEAEKSDGIPLLGMSLLSGSELNMHVRPGGRVSIKPLARFDSSRRGARR